MPKNSIRVEVYTADSDDPLPFEGVNFISLVNNETYGIPALIADEKGKADGLPVRILYVNPENIVCMQADRES